MGIGGWRYGAGRPAYRLQAENYRSLDIRRMVKANCIKPSHSFGWVWRDSDGERIAGIACAVNETASLLTVSYTWKNYYEDERKEISRSIWLIYTPCNYGGVRHWFNCPCCNRRMAVLYIMGNSLRCGKCGRISYASQRGNAMDRAWIKQRKIEAKLIDGWQKPKRMRWKTFERLQAGINECERQKDCALMMAMAKLGHWL